MELDESKIFFNTLAQLRIDLLKDIIEMRGDDFGKTENVAVYHNYMDSEVTTMAGFSTQALTITSAQAKANGLRVINLLMNRLGLTKEQAAGIAGVMMAESNVNPGSVNIYEKLGKYKNSKANGAGYGAGLVQWSMDRKRKALALIGSPGPIESLSLDTQVEILARELETTYKATLAGIKKSTTASQAAATFYCHSIAGWSSSREPATQAEIDRNNEKYKTVGANSQINKGMGYAEGFMNI